MGLTGIHAAAAALPRFVLFLGWSGLTLKGLQTQQKNFQLSLFILWGCPEQRIPSHCAGSLTADQQGEPAVAAAHRGKQRHRVKPLAELSEALGLRIAEHSGACPVSIRLMCGVNLVDR